VPDEHYENPKLAALYDVVCPWSPDRDFYLALASDPALHVLDLGCGTGLLCHAYALQGHIVTGVDPAIAMLDMARRKPHTREITWVHATAQEYRSTSRFDLVIMTGHVFQVLLEDSDLDAALATVRRHLKPEGRFVFESRNPAVDWVAKWNGTEHFTWQGGVIDWTTEVLARVADRITFVQRCRWAGESLESFSELRFLSQSAIVERLHAAGLRVAACYGDWVKTPFDPATSHEMIFDVRPASHLADVQ
jgi:ubiquinone/menaquinone biosynthesis C-methylase UbiE